LVVKIDEYQLVRSAAERGSDVVVRVMAAHPTNMAIQIQGWLQLATFDYPGTRTDGREEIDNSKRTGTCALIHVR
jgi:hypothetical protein